MLKEQKFGKDITKGFRALVEKFLEVGPVGAQVALSDNSAVYALLTDKKMAEKADPYAPYYPGNAANFVKYVTRRKEPSGPVIFVLRPCEVKAVVELSKLGQVNLDNITLVSFDCAGTVPRTEFKEKAIPSGTDFMKKRDSWEVREICKSCDLVRHPAADVQVMLFDAKGDLVPIYAATEKGKRLVELLDGDAKDTEPPSDGLAKEQTARLDAQKKLFARLDSDVAGDDNLFRTFASCINCHNCMTNCPICICRECFFESEALEFDADTVIELAGRKGALRAPADTMLFQIGRMSHMSTSCVGCGACEEACPQDIPVGRVFKWVASRTQALFDYHAGYSFNEQIPLKEFKEDELSPV